MKFARPAHRAGSGSPCSSPTSPRPSPRPAARPRPTPCGRRGATRRPAASRDGRRHRARRCRPTDLRRGDVVVVEAGEVIPSDGEIIEGVASIDESAITGESAPVIREAGGDRSGVTGGTRVLSDRIVVEITAEPGESLPRPHDRPGRRGHPPEDAQRDRPVARAGRVHADLPDRHRHALAMPDRARLLSSSGTASAPTADPGRPAGLPDPHDHRRAAGRHRHRRHGPGSSGRNIIAKSGKAVEVAGDVDTLLLDKTGTITVGNRQAAEFVPFGGFTAERDWPTRPPGLAGRRDARRQEHRRAARQLGGIGAATARDLGARARRSSPSPPRPG